MDVIDIRALYKPEGWVEIMTKPDMGSWIKTNNEQDWYEPFPGIFWISPRLYTFWKLKWG